MIVFDEKIKIEIEPRSVVEGQVTPIGNYYVPDRFEYLLKDAEVAYEKRPLKDEEKWSEST